MYRRCKALLLMSIVCVAACSNRQVYDALQQNRQLECQKLPQNQYEKCMQELSEPYDEYARKRAESQEAQ